MTISTDPNVSDEYYRQRHARRVRIIYLIGGLVALGLCLYYGVINVYHDFCTGSFERSPRAVIQSYIGAIESADAQNVARCWDRNLYKLDTGCSEICLERILGTQYEIVAITLEGPYETEEGRDGIEAHVTATCAGASQQHTGEITLDTVGNDLPWRHWKIVSSTFGGATGEPWCQQP